MHVDLKITTSEEYFSQTHREIDWDEDDSSKVSIAQLYAVEKILATEFSIFLLRRSTGFDSNLIDNMVDIRRELIEIYDLSYEKYVSYNDFY